MSDLITKALEAGLDVENMTASELRLALSGAGKKKKKSKSAALIIRNKVTGEVVFKNVDHNRKNRFGFSAALTVSQLMTEDAKNAALSQKAEELGLKVEDLDAELVEELLAGVGRQIPDAEDRSNWKVGRVEWFDWSEIEPSEDD